MYNQIEKTNASHGNGEGMPPSFISNRHLNIFQDEEGNPHVYVTENIDSPVFYLGLIRLLCNVPEDIEVHLHFNTVGGSMDTTTQLIANMKRCKAKLIGYAEGGVSSAGSVLLLNCDEYVVCEGSYMMCHYYSTGYAGKGQDIEAYASHTKSSFRPFFKKIYTGFLTKKEIKKMFDGTDIWIKDEDLVERLKAYSEYKVRKHAELLFDRQEEMRDDELQKVRAYLDEVEGTPHRSVDDIVMLLKGEDPDQVNIMDMISQAIGSMTEEDLEDDEVVTLQTVDEPRVKKTTRTNSPKRNKQKSKDSVKNTIEAIAENAESFADEE
jgi:ATP-dependent protease ClpP protease subunit